MKKILAGLLVLSLLALVGCSREEMQMQSADSAAKGPAAPAAASRPADDPSTGDNDLTFSILESEKVDVDQNAETDVEMSVIRHSEYVLASASMGGARLPTSLVLAGKFQGAVKLLSEVLNGGKGVTVKFDPETVKGSEDRAKLKLTAATCEGRTTSASVTLEVRIYKKR